MRRIALIKTFCDKEAIIWQIKIQVPAHRILMPPRTFSAGAKYTIVV